MTKKILFSLCVLCACHIQASAQKLAVAGAKLSIKIQGGKSTVKAGDQVILKAKGYNEEVSILQWQVSTDGVTWQNMPKANGENFETSPLTESQFFCFKTADDQVSRNRTMSGPANGSAAPSSGRETSLACAPA